MLQKNRDNSLIKQNKLDCFQQKHNSLLSQKHNSLLSQKHNSLLSQKHNSLLSQKHNSLLSQKKGLSEIVGYVLLIVIALAVSSLVFIWVKGIIPIDTAECPDVSLTISDYNCNAMSGTINLSVKNSGLFNINGFFIKGSDNESRMAVQGLNSIGTDNKGNINFGNLEPGEIYTGRFDYSSLSKLEAVEIEPFLFIDNKKVLCDKAIIRQKINC